MKQFFFGNHEKQSIGETMVILSELAAVADDGFKNLHYIAEKSDPDTIHSYLRGQAAQQVASRAVESVHQFQPEANQLVAPAAIETAPAAVEVPQQPAITAEPMSSTHAAEMDMMAAARQAAALNSRSAAETAAEIAGSSPYPLQQAQTNYRREDYDLAA